MSKKSNKLITSLVAVVIFSLTGCDSLEETKNSLDNNQKESTEKEIIERTGVEDKDNNYQELASTAVFYTTYKGSVTTEDTLDWYVLENVKADREYYFNLTNLGDKNANRQTTKIKFAIYDDEGEIEKTELTTLYGKKSYILTPKNNGKLYIKFYSHDFGLVYTNSRFEFDIKTGFEEGLEQNTTTFEYNEFQKVSFPIDINQTYKSSAIWIDDTNDWYVLENLKSDEEYNFHIVNLGDKNTNRAITEVHFNIYDEDSKIQSAFINTITEKKTYTFTPLNDGKVYIQFFTNQFYTTSRYEFNINKI